MLSRKTGQISPSLKRWIFILPGFVPYRLQISLVSTPELVPAKIFADCMTFKCDQRAVRALTGLVFGAVKILLSPQSALSCYKNIRPTDVSEPPPPWKPVQETLTVFWQAPLFL
jgi:hypothetical protein